MERRVDSKTETLLKKFHKVVLWGLRTQRHTHRYIHHTFYRTLRKINAPVVWVDDTARNASAIEKNDLVISVNIAGRHLPLLNDVFYCLHNFDDTVHDRIAPSKNIRLQVYTNQAEINSEKWDAVTFFNTEKRQLCQPWGTDLTAEEFLPPVEGTRLKISFWIGSIWNNELNQGNLREIAALKKALARKSITFIPLHGVPDRFNKMLVRASLIAPAIGGGWQAENNYLPCRMFKNISYGQLGISNVKKFSDLFGKEFWVAGDTIEELVDQALFLDPKRKREIILAQQDVVKKHTYIDKVNNILKAFELVSGR